MVKGRILNLHGFMMYQICGQALFRPTNSIMGSNTTPLILSLKTEYYASFTDELWDTPTSNSLNLSFFATTSRAAEVGILLHVWTHFPLRSHTDHDIWFRHVWQAQCQGAWAYDVLKEICQLLESYTRKKHGADIQLTILLKLSSTLPRPSVPHWSTGWSRQHWLQWWQQNLTGSQRTCININHSTLVA